MKIALFSTNESSGGAARATYRLKNALIQSDACVKYFVQNLDQIKTDAIPLQVQDKNYKELEYKLNYRFVSTQRIKQSNTLFSFSYADSILPSLDEFDVINIHWIEYFLSLNNLYEMIRLNKPIIWTLHDMKPFTGGCHYNASCREFESDCCNCLQLQGDSELPQKVLHAKKEIFDKANLTIVTPSVWLADEVKKSSLFHNKRVEVIPNSIDSSVFKAIDKDTAKLMLNIETNKTILLFGAASNIERRKGFKELVESTRLLKEMLKNKNVIAMFFGVNNHDDFPLPYINIGQVFSDEQLSVIYSAADIFILPSLEDNLPNTLLESMSCATPVVAFDTGGVKDIVDDSTGKVVPKGNIEALSKEINNLINNKNLRMQKGKNARETILKRYQSHHQASKYIELFDDLKGRSAGHMSRKIDTSGYFDSFIACIYKEGLKTKEYLFSKNINSLHQQISFLDGSIVLYGFGVVGKMIKALMPEKIIDYVDIKEIDKHPVLLKNMNFDKIIITVLGREEEIVEYLTNEIKVDQSKIVCIKVE